MTVDEIGDVEEEEEEEEETEDGCLERELSFCRGVLPYGSTVLPNWVGDSNEAERNLSVPYFEIIAESQCHPRIQQFACAVLEPPCRRQVPLPPCRNFCRGKRPDNLPESVDARIGFGNPITASGC